MRDIIAQQFTTFAFSVPITAAPIAPNLQLTSLIDTFAITVPAAAANSVFLGGDAGVTITTGLELLAGTTTIFTIDHDGRQLYELQYPLKDTRDSVKCTDSQLIEIPFITWDMSQIYLVAVAVTNVTVACFKAMYI